MTPCPKCGEVHVTPHGHPACIGHAKSRENAACRRPPLPYQRVCQYHGGKAPNSLAKARREQALDEARKEITMRLGGSMDIDVGEGLPYLLRGARWNVAVLERLVSQLDTGVHTPAQTDDEDAEAEDHGLHGSIAGRIDPENWKAAPHVFVAMYNDERDRLARYDKMCIDTGIKERQTRVQEAQVDVLVSVVKYALDGILGELVKHGVSAEVVSQVTADMLPTVMRHAFEKAHAIEVGEAGG